MGRDLRYILTKIHRLVEAEAKEIYRTISDWWIMVKAIEERGR